MKLPTLTLLIIFAQQTGVQQALAQSTEKSTSRIVISLSGGAFIPQQPGTNVEGSFLYTSTSVSTGVTTTHQYSGSLGGNFTRLAFVGDIMNIEVTSKSHAINGGFGLFQDIAGNDEGILKAGYSRVLPFHRDRFRLQLGVNLDGVLGSDMELGRIDNKGQTLQLLGHTSPPQWIETHVDRYRTYTQTYNADHLSVLYRRNGLLLEPKVVITTSLKRIVLGVEAGWMFQLLQGCILKLEQQDGGNNHRNTIAKIHEPRNGSMNGLYVAFRAGMIYRSHNKLSK